MRALYGATARRGKRAIELLRRGKSPLPSVGRCEARALSGHRRQRLRMRQQFSGGASELARRVRDHAMAPRLKPDAGNPKGRAYDRPAGGQ